MRAFLVWVFVEPAPKDRPCVVQCLIVEFLLGVFHAGIITVLLNSQKGCDITLHFIPATVFMTDNTYSLSELLQSISDTLSDVYEGAYWITAELAAVHAKGKGYWVLELQEANDKGQKLAQTQAFVWNNNAARVIYRFERETGQKLGSGMRVKIRVQVGFHPQWGFRLTVDDIDTAWSLGEAQANNQKIRDTLRQGGVWDLNRALPRPRDFCRVAIVSPDTSAGLEDFMREANVLSQFQLAHFDVINAPFEGPNAANGIAKAFQTIVQSKKPYDAVCVVRGGGAASGIAWLNQEAIVRAVATCPIPVLSGIGHERDQTLVDEVSNTVCGTPSKTIGLITSTIIGNAQDASNAWTAFQHEIEGRLRLAHQKLDEQAINIGHLAKSLIDRARLDTESLLREAVNLGPLATMQRGYALVRHDDALVKTAQDARQHEHLNIRFADGDVRVTVDPSSSN